MARPETLQQALPGLWRMFRYFSPYLARYRALIAGSFLALFAQVGARLLEPWPLKFIFDRVLISDAPAGGAPAALDGAGMDPMIILTISAAAVVLIAILRALAAYASTVGFALVGNQVLAEVRGDLYRHLQGLSLAFHTRTRTGDMTIRVISDVGMLRDVMVTAFMPLLGNVMILIGMLAVMLWLQWQLTLLALLVAPLFWLRTARLSRRIQEVSRQQRSSEGAMASTAAESMSAIKVVQALSLERVFAEGFASKNRQDLREGVKAKRLEAALERTVDVLVAVSTALVLWFGVQLVLLNQLTPGELLVFISYLKNGYRPVRDFAKYTGRLAKASAAGERIIDVLSQEPDVRDLPGAVPAPPFRGAVRFEDVTFGYEPGQPVLEDVDFEVRPGQRVAIVAPSGSGKSTLANLILRLYDPLWGSVKIDGRDIRRYTLESLRRQISVVLQDNLLFAASIRDNIAYGTPDATMPEIEAAARLANAHEFISALPQGYDTIVGERGVTLSGGQRQRIAIARAAIRKAPILILDEPTTGLDEENERAVIDALERVMRGSTTFVISHDLNLASRADLIFYLENGRLAERGTHEELMQADGRYAALYRLQTLSRRREGHEEDTYALVSES